MHNSVKLLLVFSLAVILGTIIANGELLTYARDTTRVLSVLEERVPTEPVKILFVGDMMYDRHIRKMAEKTSYDFLLEDLASTLDTYDLVVGNLEGPVTTYKSKSRDTIPGEPANFVFTFAPEVANHLYNSNIRLVNIGNNHISNFGKKGREETREFLTRSGVEFFGDEEDARYATIEKEINGVRIAFVNYNQFGGKRVDKTTEEIESAKTNGADFIVVYTHWGEEYLVTPPAYIKNRAELFINFGADLVIGSHPHVVQGHENYNGGEVYYSLGNFVFDQYWNDRVSNGLMVEAVIADRHSPIVTRGIPVTLTRDGKTSLSRVAP